MYLLKYNINSLVFLIIFSFLRLLSENNQPNDIPTSKNNNERKDLNKFTKGYFRTKTSFYDKEGKPKLLNRDFKSLTFDELEHNRKIHVERDSDKETIIRYTERMIALCKDPIRIRQLRIEVADMYFDVDNYERAGAFYSEFVKLYPGNEQAERAAYRNIVSKFLETLPSDKDQSLTKEVMKLCKSFIDNSNFKTYKNEVIKVIKKCKKKLIDYELNIFNFYLNKGNLKAAQKRFENIKKDLLANSKEDKSIIKEMKNQLDAAKNKKNYKPEYEITNNSSLFDFFISRKKEEMESDNFMDKYKETKNNIDDLKKDDKKKEINMANNKTRKIDYVTKL